MSSDVVLSREQLARLKEVSDTSAVWEQFSEKTGAESQSDTVRLSENELSDLAEELGLEPVALLRGSVDYRALAAHQSGHVSFLPARYARGESRMRTSAHLFDIIEERFGWRARSRVLRKRQMTEAVIADPELKVNVQLVTEICDELQCLGMNETEFYRLGQRSLIQNYQSEVGNRMRAARTTAEQIDSCFNEIVPVFYERNSVYQLVRLTQDSAVVDVYPASGACDSVSSKKIGSALTCLNRAGSISCITGYRRLPFAQVRESRCIHRGDPYCRIEIDFAHAAYAEKSVKP